MTSPKAKISVLTLFLVLPCLSFGPHARAAQLTEPGIFMLPMNCTELLAEPAPFINYFEAVGRGLVLKNRGLSQRIFRVLAMREKVADAFDRQRDQHPIDTLVRKTLCFYRNQREPLKPVLYDDEKFIGYLSTGMADLEQKVEEVVFQWESERVQRLEYERRVEKNQLLISRLKEEADRQAEATLIKLRKKARAGSKDQEP